jgi:hypothetical protein
MGGQIFDDVRRILLSLLFMVAFGWMAAQIVPGSEPSARVSPQVALAGEVVPPHP